MISKISALAFFLITAAALFLASFDMAQAGSRMDNWNGFDIGAAGHITRD